jgi:hypothetical protein
LDARQSVLLNDQADEGSDDAPVRHVESDRRLDGGQIAVEAARADGKELGKESESIAMPCREKRGFDFLTAELSSGLQRPIQAYPRSED